MFRNKKGSWKEGDVERSEEGRDNSMMYEREKTEREYIGTMQEWWEPHAFPDLWLSAPVVPLLRNGTIDASGES